MSFPSSRVLELIPQMAWVGNLKELGKDHASDTGNDTCFSRECFSSLIFMIRLSDFLAYGEKSGRQREAKVKLDLSGEKSRS